jgi:hypothetical protein
MMLSRTSRARSSALLALGLAFMAVAQLLTVGQNSSRSRVAVAAILVLVAAIHAYRAWRGRQAQ